MKEVQYSVIIPVFNSDCAILSVVQRVRETMGQLRRTYEVILVDDGSSDGSWQCISELMVQYPLIVRGMRHASNRGQYEATRTGMVGARGTVIITLDDDLEIPEAGLKTLIETFESQSVKLLYGYLENKHYSSVFWKLGSLFVLFLGNVWLRFSSPLKQGKWTVWSSVRVFRASTQLTCLAQHSRYVCPDLLLLHLYTQPKSISLGKACQSRCGGRYGWWKKLKQIWAIVFTLWVLLIVGGRDEFKKKSTGCDNL